MITSELIDYLLDNIPRRAVSSGQKPLVATFFVAKKFITKMTRRDISDDISGYSENRIKPTDPRLTDEFCQKFVEFINQNGLPPWVESISLQEQEGEIILDFLTQQGFCDL